MPEISLVVTAYNEESIIKEKILNTLSLDYPEDKLKIIFITDGSTDSTPYIIGSYPRITLLHHSERKGKLAAMNRVIEHINTEYVIFSDANTLLNPDCIKKIVPHYANALTGGVSGEKKVSSSNNAVSGEGIYWKYESFLKKLDSELYTTVGAAGELFSIRTSLYTPLPENTIIEDFVQSLLLCMKGYKVKYEPLAFSQEKASLTITDEMERKIRISAGAFRAMGLLKSCSIPSGAP